MYLVVTDSGEIAESTQGGSLCCAPVLLSCIILCTLLMIHTVFRRDFPCYVFDAFGCIGMLFSAFCGTCILRAHKTIESDCN